MNYLGIDIGGTNLKAGIVSGGGKILFSSSIKTPTNLTDFSAALNNLVAGLSTKVDNIQGIGIGCKGIIDPQTTEVLVCPGTFSFLEQHRLKDFVKNLFSDEIPVVADNDARAALVGEYVWGAAKDRKNALMFTLGTGLGGAILAEGKIVRGVNGVAGHLGHITINPDGAICICGNRGCLEAYFSASAIEAAALHAIHRGCESALTTRFSGDYHKLTCLDVFQAADEGDYLAKDITENSIRHLAAGIAGLLHVFDPEIVIIGGNIAQAGKSLFTPLEREIQNRTKRWLSRVVPLVPPQVADTSGIAGAAALSIKD